MRITKKKVETPNDSIRVKNCYHCGTPAEQEYTLSLPESKSLGEEDSRRVFCCNGCKSAFLFIQTAQLGRYYDNREDFAPKVDESQSDFVPKKNIQKLRYEIFEKTLTPDKNGHYSASFFVEGLHCASCVWLSEKVLHKVAEVVEANIQLVSGILYMTWSPKITLSQIAQKLAQLGYVLNPTSKESLPDGENMPLKKMVTAGFFAGNNMLISIALFAGFFSSIDVYTKMLFHFVSALLTTPVLFYSAGDFYKRAWHGLRHNIINMDLLLSVGLGLAYVYSLVITMVPAWSQSYEVYFETVSFVTFVVLVGQYLEGKLRLRGKQFGARLLVSLPQVALRLKKNLKKNLKKTATQKTKKKNDFYSDDFEAVAVDSVVQGDTLYYTPESILHCDAILLSKKAEIDMAVVTGESHIIEKNYGDTLSAGARIVASSAIVKTVNTAQDSSLVSMKNAVYNALSQKTENLELAEKYSRVFVIFVLFASLITFFSAIFFYDSSVNSALLRTLTMLLVACPCALNLAIPTAHVASIQQCLKRGILIKNVAAFSRIFRSKTIFIDKTGTLTEGKPSVKQIKLFDKSALFKNEHDVTHLCAAMEAEFSAQHPFAQAFARLANPQKVIATQKKFQQGFYLAGGGIFAPLSSSSGSSSNREAFFLGSPKILSLLSQKFLEKEVPAEDEKLFASAHQFIRENPSHSHIVLLRLRRLPVKLVGGESLEDFWAKNKLFKAKVELSAVVALSDTLKADAKEVLGTLQKRYKVVLISGDGRAAVENLASELRIEHFYAELTPKQKAEMVAGEKQLLKTPLLMVGDGVNDAMSLAVADVGISFAHASDLSVYSADVLLMQPNLTLLSEMLQVSRKSHKVTNQNLLMSVGYNIFLLPAAAAGLIIPLIGSLAMSLSSIVVVLNSMRILRRTSSKK